MKLSRLWKYSILVCSMLFVQTVFAETPAEETDKKCIKPKFRDFAPADKSEVAPESKITFHINRYADPLHIAASAKKIPMKVEVNDKKTFYLVTAKLPKELTDGFVRIHIEAKSTEGDCIGQDGWLIKVRPNSNPAPVKEPVPEQTESVTE